MNHIRTGDSEPIEAVIVDNLGQLLPGLTNLRLQVRRISDNLYLDWNDNSFKANPALPLQDLYEINPSKSPGEYALHVPTMGHTWGFNTAALTNALNDDVYCMLLIQDGAPQSALNVPQVNHLKVGSFMNYLDEAISAQTSPDDVKLVLREYGLDHLVAINPGIVPPAANTYIRQILDKQNQLLAGQQVYSVQQNWAYRAPEHSILGQIWIEAQNLVVLGATNCTINWCTHPAGLVLFSATATGPDSRGVFSVVQSTDDLITNQAYYIEATIEVPGYGPVKGIKGVFTIG